MKVAKQFHLTYCSNIHPGESWEEVRGNLATYLPPIRKNLCPSAPFGVGLRLSAEAAETLDAEEHLREFKEFLSSEDCYVFTINGFPYGRFHRARVKEEVYLPDWKNEARLEYTNRLARILAALLPEDPALEGSVSTVPGAFKPEVRSSADVWQMSRLLLRHVAFLHTLREETGKTISLALEPEPCCYLETLDEAVAFFRDYLLQREGLQFLSSALGGSPQQAEVVLRRHLGICYDACHMAVEYEEVPEGLGKLRAAGIRICKFQISSALRLQFQSGDGKAEESLLPFAETTYLHQVVERSSEGIVRYTDLPEGLSAEVQSVRTGRRGPKKEWRVHFHIPIFLPDMDQFGTTQDHLVSLINFLKRDALCPYLEVETYTWDVLPQEYKTLDTVGAITRELAWVRDRLES